MLKRKLLIAPLVAAAALSMAACTTQRDYSARAGSDLPGGGVEWGYGGESRGVSVPDAGRENSTPSVFDTRYDRARDTAFPSGSRDTSTD